MQSNAVGSHLLLCCYSRPRRPLHNPTAVTHVRTELSLPIRHTYVAAVGQRAKSLVVSSSLTQLNWNVTHRHILALNLIASVAAFSTAWLFIYGIPALLALRKAAESLENELDIARERLPEAMADVRLSGMEISDLTMELSDLGQEITHKVKRGTQLVRVVEENLRQFASLAGTGTQERAQPMDDTNYPPLAKSVRGVKEGIVKSRSSFQMLISFTYYLRLVRNFIATKAQEKSR